MNPTFTPQAIAQLVDEQPQEFRVSTAAYRGEAMFEQELESIFYRTWIYLAHESEIANPCSTPAPTAARPFAAKKPATPAPLSAPITAGRFAPVVS